jgi:hypothetical protein
MQHEDFIIQLSVHPAGGYNIRVVQSPHGGRGRAHCRTPFKEEELNELVGATRSIPARDLLQPVSISLPPLTAEEVGDRLFRTLFIGSVKDLFVSSLAAVEDSGRALRLQLRIDLPELARLHDLPWELLYDSDLEEFLGLSRQTLFVRSLDVPRPERPLTIPKPLRILAIAADLQGPEYGSLELARELNNLRTAARQERVELEVLEDARRESLAAALAKQRFDILHVLGHGWFDAENGRGGLCFKAPDGTVERVDGRDLAVELREFRDLQVVFLNACSTGRAAGDGRKSPFAGAATALVLGGFPAVVAMRARISDRAAIGFSHAFYQRLLAGDPIEEAVRQGRLALHRERIPGSAEWSVPVLFLHGRSIAPARSVAPEGLVIPGPARKLLDRTVPRLHQALTRSGLLPAPLPLIHEHLQRLRAEIEEEIKEKTYLPLQARTVPYKSFGADRKAVDVFNRRVHVTIRQMLAPDTGGDSVDAETAALHRRSRLVRNLVHTLLKSREPLVLLGDPGSGKTMALHEAILTLIRAESRCVFPIVPLYIRLGEFHADGKVEPANVYDLVRKAAPPSLRPWLDGLERERRLVLFFDGMDEMSRDRYAEHTHALSQFAEERKGNVRTLFSCRIADFSPTFTHRRLALLPFSRAQIAQYLRRNLIVPSLEIDGQVWTVPDLARFLATRDLSVDTSNPFVLWLLCQYLYLQKTWPASRVDLLASFLKQSYARKLEEAKEEGRELPAAEAALHAWARFAYVITERNCGSAISVEILLADMTDARAMIAAGIWCGVLTESLEEEEEQIRFEHHRFQEYFTALWIRQQAPTISWLDKLDAPRWQETMLNLVLMGGAEDGVRSLADAVAIEVRELEATIEEKAAAAVAVKTPDGEASPGASPPVLSLAAAEIPYEREAVLADRVELGARLIHGAPNAPAVKDSLRPALRKGLDLLAGRGRPVTQVKMMRACQHLEDVELGGSLDQLLGSPVRWVRDQALVLVSAARSGQGVGQHDLATAIAIHLAAGQILTRWPVFLRAVTTARSHRIRSCFFWATAFALVDLGLLLAVAWGLFVVVLAGLYALDRPMLAPLLSGLQYVSPPRLWIFQALVTSAATLIGLRLAPGSAWVWALCSVPLGVIALITCAAMWNGTWVSFYLLLFLIPLYLFAPLFAVLAAPPHLLTIFLYSRMPRRLCGSRCTPATLYRIASRDYREAFSALKETGRLFVRMAPLFWSRMGLLALALIFTSSAGAVSRWLNVPYRPGISELFFLLFFCGGAVLVFRLSGRTDLASLGKLGLEILLRFLFGVIVSAIILFVISGFSRAVAGILIAGGLLVLLVLLLRRLAALIRLSVATRHPLPPQAYSPEGWIAAFRKAAPEEQERLLIATSPRSLGLPLPGFQQLLLAVEPLVREEPALSAYWNRRDQIEQALRQERIG